jgi:spoIIIJ-associated protein
MDGYKEFQGKSLDDAIREACSYFDAPREKLEIDIVQDAKSGIFGIVGARKAKIRARRAQIGRMAPAGAAVQPEASATATSAVPAEDADASGERTARVARTHEERPRDERPREDRPREDRPRRERGETTAPALAEAAAARPDIRDDADADSDSAVEDDGRKPEGERGERDDRGGRRRRRGGRGRRERDGEPRGDRPDGNGRGESDVADDAATDASRPGGRPARAPRDQNAQRPSRGPRPARQPLEDDGNGQSGQPGRRGPRRNGEQPDRLDRPDRSDRPARSDRPDRAAGDASFPADMLDDADEHGGDGLPEIPLEQLDQEQVKQVAVEVMERLVTPIIGEAGFAVELAEGRVNVSVDCGENSGLLIGREGQTLSALQYLASRIVSRKLGSSVRVQLDSGDYRERQDDKLRDIALHLAEKVRATGKPQSTRPLSSYHRRVVHVTLQDDEEVVTRSKGDGPLKRVIIMRRRKG